MAKKDAVVLESGEKIESIGPWTIAWRKFRQNRVAMAGYSIFNYFNTKYRFDYFYFNCYCCYCDSTNAWI